jgi:hypothetical protein
MILWIFVRTFRTSLSLDRMKVRSVMCPAGLSMARVSDPFCSVDVNSVLYRAGLSMTRDLGCQIPSGLLM